MRELTSALAASQSIYIDFSAASESSFEVIPPGDYAAVVETAEIGTTKAGDPKVVFRFKLTEPGFEGRVVFKHAPVTGKGGGITREARPS